MSRTVENGISEEVEANSNDSLDVGCAPDEIARAATDGASPSGDADDTSEAESSDAAVVADPEDMAVFYESARVRFEWQERYRERFAARTRQLLVVLTGLGGVGVALMNYAQAAGRSRWCASGAYR